MNIVAKDLQFGLSCFFLLLISAGCSSQKYDSWSECLASESATNASKEAVQIYCDSNYKMSIDEKATISKIASDKFNRENGIRPAPPKVGQIKGGYRFEGGDPANPANWTPIE